MTVACVLVAAGMAPAAAFALIETTRGRPVPDTEEQRAWVERYAAGMRQELPSKVAEPSARYRSPHGGGEGADPAD